jgi:hypothetical protein
MKKHVLSHSDSLFWKSNVSHVRTAGFYYTAYTSPTAKDPKCGTMANEEAIQTSWFKVMTGMVTHVCWWKHVGVITPHGPHTTSFLITSQFFWNLNVNLSHKNTTYFQLNPHICPGKHPFVFG